MSMQIINVDKKDSVIFTEPNVRTSPEVLSSPGKKALRGSVVYNRVIYCFRAKNIHQERQE